MRALLIVNPVASRVNAAVERTAQRELETAAELEVVRTTRPLGAADLARRAVDEAFDAVIVLGEVAASEHVEPAVADHLRRLIDIGLGFGVQSSE